MKKLLSIQLIIFICIAIFFVFGVKAYQSNDELLVNGGFENADTSMWAANSCTLTRDSNNKKSGSYSIMVTGRSQYYASPGQDITSILNQCGQGTYSFSAYMKLLSGEASASMYIVISIECTDVSEQWHTGNAAIITNSTFTQSIGTEQNITWQGTLTRALIYIQNVDSSIKSDLYVDDISLVKTSPIITLSPAPTYIATAQTLEKRGSGKPSVGAIRWDAWLPSSQSTFGWSTENNVGAQVARSLGPNKYHFRLPYFSIVNGDNNVDFPPYTQSTMDNEIRYAEYAGIDFWAYCWYPIGSGMDTARNMHVSSGLRDKVKMCAILNVNPFGSAERAQLVSYMKESFYMKVQGGRPLLFFFYDPNPLPTIIAIQQDCIAQGIPLPYCVSMGSMNTGIDAVSNYAITGSDGEAFSSLAQRAESNWNTQRNAGNEVVPLVSCGWDNRTRYDHQVSWGTVPANSWVQTATASEIATHLQNGVNWTNSNTSNTLANAVLMYAWNEHDEGGWLCPTVKVDADGNALKDGLYNQVNSDRVVAVHNVLNPVAIPTVNPWATPVPTIKPTAIPNTSLPSSPNTTAGIIITPDVNATPATSIENSEQPSSGTGDTIENNDTATTSPDNLANATQMPIKMQSSGAWAVIIVALVILLAAAVTTVFLLKKKNKIN